MAKNSKTFKGLGKRFIAGMWNWAIRPVLAVIFSIVWTILCLAALLLSPFWFPVYAWKDPEGLALNLNSAPDRHKDDPWIADVIYFDLLVLLRFCRWFYAPLINMLPMRKRAEFIRQGVKRLNEYPVKTQVAFYKSHNAEGKQSLISSNSLSKEVFDKIWEEPFERENWVAAGMVLTKGQVSDMVLSGATDLLWRYFKRNTPDKEMFGVLVKLAAKNYATAQDIVYKLIRQQRPSAELIGQLLNIDNSQFVNKVRDVVDQYADLDAISFDVCQISGCMTDEEKENMVRECWANFCASKKEISRAAQKKMTYEQYIIFAKTGHRLEYYALQHLCLTVNNSDYLKEIIKNEFEKLDDNLQTALKSAYGRYSVYLAVKQERETAAQK